VLPGDRFAKLMQPSANLSTMVPVTLFRHNSVVKFRLAAISDLHYLRESHVCLVRPECVHVSPFPLVTTVYASSDVNA